MRPRRARKRWHRFDSSVGSSFDDRDKSRRSPIGINRDRYNSLDGPLRLNTI